MIPERMTRACAVSIMNACLHELVWVMRASGESAWRLESTTQQQWCTGYEPGDCCCSHPSSASESACSLDVGLVPAALQRVVGLTSRLDCTLAPSTAEGTVPAGRAADGLPRRHWYRTAELGRIDPFTQFTATYALTPPTARALNPAPLPIVEYCSRRSRARC